MKGKLMKWIFGMLLALVVIGLLPSAAHAWDEEVDCEFCGAVCGDDYICGGGNHCSEDSGRSCYDEHHCGSCGACDTESEDDFCEECNLCVECATDEGAHCPSCNACSPAACCMECGQCLECAMVCDICMRCEDCWSETPHCWDCELVCGSEAELCILCGICMDCGEICDGCDGICAQCAMEEGYHCWDCGACLFESGFCDGCGGCYECNDYCSEGDSHLCLKCHLAEDMACPDCGLCFAEDESDRRCGCGGCYECNGTCSEGTDHACLACHVDLDLACSSCGECFIDKDGELCPDCCICSSCAYLCSECFRCDSCTELCEHCDEMCLECHESSGELCPMCGMCGGDEPVCEECGACSWCAWICDSCGLCGDGDCIYSMGTHCPECDECFEENGECPSGGEHCAGCCEENDWLCPSCGDCIEGAGYELVCRDCGACEGCSEFCDWCGDFCLDCLIHEESLHCPGCGNCYEEVHDCHECDLCEECVEICEFCDWDYCMECAAELGFHCTDCGISCRYGNTPLCGDCGRCADCAEYCEYCQTCVDCAIEAEDHCMKCGTCENNPEGPGGLCYCGLCAYCLEDVWCGTCGGCQDCMAYYHPYAHCKGCHLCFDHYAPMCEGGCGYCEDCCKCARAHLVFFSPGTGTGTMDPVKAYGTYTLPACEFKAPTRSLFLGWSVNGVVVNAGDTVNITANTTVTAVWAELSLTGYTVTYNANGGTGAMPPQKNVSGTIKLPLCLYTPPAGKEFKAYLINGVEYQPGDRYSVTAPTVIKVLWRNVSLGVTVSGKITSSGSKTDEITVQLTLKDTNEVAYEAVVKGNSANYYIYGVSAGSYTVKVTKNGHDTYAGTIAVGTSGVKKNITLHTPEQHSYKSAVTYPVLTPSNTVTNGYTTFTCEGCGHSYVKNYTFPDVPNTLWSYNAIEFSVAKGFFTGYKSGNFGPTANITRQDFVVVLARIAKVDLSKYSGRTGFPDVKAGDYYEAAVKWASSNGIVNGYNNGKFGVGDQITREQMVTILYNYAKKCGYDVSVPESAAAKLSAYTDAGKITGYARPAVIWALYKGVISGMTSTTIAPQNPASRGQAATILMNISKKGIMPI